MKWEIAKLGKIAIIRTGKLDSNAAVIGGRYPFFTCDPNTLSIDVWAYDTEAVLLAGNNASGNYTAKYYKGKFNAYQRTYIIESANEEELNIRYLCYALNQQLRLLKMMSSGSTTKFLTVRMLDNLDIPLFGINIQTQIVNILSAYDDLIENNQKQIKLLEEAAQRIYKEWFVDLRFPGHENTKIVDGVPEGWSRGLLKELISVNYGKDHKKAPDDGNIPVYGSGGLMRKCNKSLFSGEAVLIPRKGSLNNIMYVDETFWTVDTMFYATMKQPHTAVFVYFFVKAFDMYSMNIGAAVPSMTTKILDAMDVVIPDKETLEKFDKLTKTYFNKIKTLQGQNERLKTARDLLLPKLMYETQKGDF
jgi:type I restriction enzyme S subunit